MYRLNLQRPCQALDREHWRQGLSLIVEVKAEQDADSHPALGYG